MFVRARNKNGTTIYGQLTTEHSAASYGMAVLVADKAFGGAAHGPGDLVGYEIDCAINAAGEYTTQEQRDALAALAERSGFVARKINGVYA